MSLVENFVLELSWDAELVGRTMEYHALIVDPVVSCLVPLLFRLGSGSIARVGAAEL
jgi:hypothetical protein